MTSAREHYDGLGAAPSRAERAAGPAFALKRLHNDFKRALIARHAPGAGLLVDVACGRGGDLQKWGAAGVKRVVGVDVSRAQVAEARRRAAQACADPMMPAVEFLETPPGLEALDAAVTPGTADVACCMFALNYFWRNAGQAQRALDRIARALKRGGRFVGVCADGARVMQLAASPEQGDGEAFELTPLWEGGQAGRGCEFGSAYTLVIRDTVLEGLDGTTPAPEYLVSWRSLKAAAERAGLAPLTEGFAHVDPSTLPSSAMRRVSGINASFAFIKL